MFPPRPNLLMIRSLHQRYEKLWPVVFFVAGFAFDIWSLGRIDSLFGIFKQGGYLLCVAFLIGLEILNACGRYQPTGKAASLWRYHELVIHFLLGSLLSEYTLFYFKSASIWSSFAFVFVLGAILLVNEFKEFEGHSGIPVRVTLFTVCLTTYFIYLVPLLLGFIGWIPFLTAVGLAGTLSWLPTHWMQRRMRDSVALIRKQVLFPALSVLAALILLYVTRLIPPLPVAIQYIGIFHGVSKEGNDYVLSYDEDGKSFWQNGEAIFFAQPGDRPHCFVRIFSPSRFTDRLQVRWLYKDAQSEWQDADAIPLPIAGGRDEGYRGYTMKSNYHPGKWQVRVETSDNRELGRVYFTIISETPSTTQPRRLLNERQ